MFVINNILKVLSSFAICILILSCSSSPELSINLQNTSEKKENVDPTPFVISQPFFMKSNDTPISYSNMNTYNPLQENATFKADDFEKLRTLDANHGTHTATTYTAVHGIQLITSIIQTAKDIADAIPNKYKFYEFDVSVTFEDLNKNSYVFERTYAIWADSKSDAKDVLKDTLAVSTAGDLLGLKGEASEIKDNIKKLKVVYLEEREGKNTCTERPLYTVFEQEISTTKYRYDFSATVDYEKQKETRKKPAVRDTFNYIGTSNLQILGAAAIDVQIEMWEQAKDNGYKKTPVPKITFTSAERISFVTNVPVSDQNINLQNQRNTLQSSVVNTPSVNTVKESVNNEDLMLLIEMYRKGLISEEEFKQAKDALM